MDLISIQYLYSLAWNTLTGNNWPKEGIKHAEDKQQMRPLSYADMTIYAIIMPS